MQTGTLIIRADASTALGTGHVMRCLALAQAWQDEGGRCVFVMAESSPGVEMRVRSEKFGISPLGVSPASHEDATRLVELACAHRANWIVVDGYRFDVEYQRTLKAAGVKILVVDDGGQCGGYCADLVLDQNLDASDTPYKNRETYTHLMLGTSYVLLRREFLEWRKWERETSTLSPRLLVTIGGTDPEGLTGRLVEALANIALPDLAITVVVGRSNSSLIKLQQFVEMTASKVDLVHDPPSMPELMSQSDLAVICAGGTVWELLYMGCATLSYARDEVQGKIIAGLHGIGALHNLGSVNKFEISELRAAIAELTVSRRRRDEMARIGREVVDGEGTRRVLRQMLRGGSG